MARSAYNYFHLPMIAGIRAIAAADELTVAHPGEHGTLASVALTLGGTALFRAGHALFKWAVFRVLSWPRVVAIAALIALIPVGFEVPMLALGGTSLIVVSVVAMWDTLVSQGRLGSPRRPTT